MATAEINTNDLDAHCSSDFTKGAARCFYALYAMDKVINSAGPEYEDFWLSQDAATNTLLAASGKQSEFMRGFLSVLAEYVCNGFQGGVLDLDGNWKPDAMMTAHELAQHRLEMINAAN